MENLIVQNPIMIFQAKPGKDIKEVITEAQKFINENDVFECDVEINGYTLNIEKETNLQELIDQYNYWQQYKLRDN